MKDNKMCNIWQVLIKCILYVILKSHTQNFHPTPLSKTGIGDGRVIPTTLLKLPKYWLIFIGDNVY